MTDLREWLLTVTELANDKKQRPPAPEGGQRVRFPPVISQQERESKGKEVSTGGKHLGQGKRREGPGRDGTVYEVSDWEEARREGCVGAGGCWGRGSEVVVMTEGACVKIRREWGSSSLKGMRESYIVVYIRPV